VNTPSPNGQPPNGQPPNKVPSPFLGCIGWVGGLLLLSLPLYAWFALSGNWENFRSLLRIDGWIAGGLVLLVALWGGSELQDRIGQKK
jgi:hypothetical protein